MVVLKMHAGPFPYTLSGPATLKIYQEKCSGMSRKKAPLPAGRTAIISATLDQGAVLKDHVAYSLPGHSFLPRFIKNYVHKKLTDNFLTTGQKLLEEDITTASALQHYPS